jgi:hypothetical protein
LRRLQELLTPSSSARGASLASWIQDQAHVSDMGPVDGGWECWKTKADWTVAPCAYGLFGGDCLWRVDRQSFASPDGLGDRAFRIGIEQSVRSPDGEPILRPLARYLVTVFEFVREPDTRGIVDHRREVAGRTLDPNILGFGRRGSGTAIGVCTPCGHRCRARVR